MNKKQPFYPIKLVDILFKRLSNKEADILCRRFGFANGVKQEEIETLGSIGQFYGITRERIRQVQIQAINKLRNFPSDSFQNQRLALIEDTISRLMEKYGGIMEENYFLSKLLKSPCDTVLNRRAILFIINQFLKDKNIEMVKPTNDFKLLWKLKSARIQFLKRVIHEMFEIVRKINHPLKTEELLDLFKQKTFYQKNKERLSDAVILSYLETNKIIKRNLFGEWGMIFWRTITPKRTTDKIYLTLKEGRKPLHFTQITKFINQYKLSKKIAHPATIHNELILDKNNYVLVGRGIYALKEWGYKPGVINDVLVDILKKRSKPMAREELVTEALKQRIVKRGTVCLALANKTKFKKLPSGYYILNQ